MHCKQVIPLSDFLRQTIEAYIKKGVGKIGI